MDAFPLQDSVCAKLGRSSRWIGTGLSLAPSFRSSPSGCADLLEAGHQQPLKPVRTSAAFQAQLLAPGGHGPGDLLIRKAQCGGLIHATMFAADSRPGRFPARSPACTPHQQRHDRMVVVAGS